MPNPLIALAEAAAAWREAELAPDIEWAARRAVLDWFATTLPGCREKPATLVIDALAEEKTSGRAVCYVDGSLRSPRQSAMINAVASHIVEFDDIFRDGGYHPGSSTIAAAFAIAQHHGLSAGAFHRAVIAGYEAGCRVSLAIQPSHYAFWHTTSTVGTIGSAAAGAVLLGCDAKAIAHAMALASSFAGGHQQNLQDEGMAKAMHPGHAADAGLLAAVCARQGITGSMASFHGPKGFAAASSDSAGDWTKALHGLGDWTPIARMTVKAHGCCGHIFPAIDGLKAMQRTSGFAVDEVAAIHVEGYGATYQMCNRPDAITAQDARFSLQYCLAAQLVLEAVRLEAFRPAALSDARIRSLMPLITVSEAADLAAAYPGRRMARLAVTLRDGRRIDHFQRTRKGDPDDPLNDDELVDKFMELAGSVLEPASVERLMQTLLHGNDLPGSVRFKP
ncbi:MmgE/PrpD family protein [Bradyrhizobium sp. BR 1432]|uniref:MmgE/PrpD family protein n=1 Tax=Bradyrhizobium sp. BR 1432 TaxID=3447966 RepID=UPI003EE4A42A